MEVGNLIKEHGMFVRNDFAQLCTEVSGWSPSGDTRARLRTLGVLGVASPEYNSS